MENFLVFTYIHTFVNATLIPESKQIPDPTRRFTRDNIHIPFDFKNKYCTWIHIEGAHFLSSLIIIVKQSISTKGLN